MLIHCIPYPLKPPLLYIYLPFPTITCFHIVASESVADDLKSILMADWSSDLNTAWYYIACTTAYLPHSPLILWSPLLPLVSRSNNSIRESNQFSCLISTTASLLSWWNVTRRRFLDVLCGARANHRTIYNKKWGVKGDHFTHMME